MHRHPTRSFHRFHALDGLFTGEERRPQQEFLVFRGQKAPSLAVVVTFGNSISLGPVAA